MQTPVNLYMQTKIRASFFICNGNSVFVAICPALRECFDK